LPFLMEFEHADRRRFKFQTADARPRPRGMTCPRFAFRCPPETREQGMPDARCIRGLVCKRVEESAHEHTGQRRRSDIPCAMALRLITRSPRGIGLSCPRRLRITGSSAPGRVDLPSADLTPTIEASDPHDFAVRFSTARQRILGLLTESIPPCDPIARTTPPRPPHPIPRFVTIAIRPSCRVRQANL
jgi:hypothetical protein